MKTQDRCRQCGLKIVPVSWWNRNYHAQHRGFCSVEHEEDYDTINALNYKFALRDEMRKAA